MSRIRTIKPEFFTSKDILTLTPLSRVFYIALWCEADRDGRLKWDLETLSYRYLPKNSGEIHELADELIRGGLVVVYEVDGKEYAEIPTFLAHQIINNRESASVIPPRVKDACTRGSWEGRKEGKGKELASADKSAFDEFWEVYPKKKSKGDAEKAWKAIKVDEDLKVTILQAVVRLKQTPQWAKDSGQYVPYPASWLRAKGWLDDVSGEELPIWERP